MRVMFLLASAVALVLITTTIALAGTYTIANCPSAGNGNSGSWTVFGAPQNYKGNCSGGPGDFIGPLGGFMAPATIDGVQLSVPAGSAITIRGARVWWYVPVQLSGATMFAIAAVNTGVVEEAATPKISIGIPDEWSLPSNTTELTLAAFCSNDHAGAGCTLGAGENPDLEFLGAQLTLADSNLPTASVTGGALAGGGPISGTAAMTFTAHDGESGVRAGNLLVDGRVVATRDYISECPYQDFAACPTSVSGELQWNSTTVGNGVHEVAMQVLNAAGNPLIVDQHSITVANQAIQTSGVGLTGAAAHAANGTPCSGEEMQVVVNNKRDALVIPYGQPATVKGVLHCGTVPARGAQIAVSTVGGPASAKIASAIKTAADGSFSYAVPSGPSRKLLFSYTAYSDDPHPSTTAQATIAVRPKITLRIKPRRTTTDGTPIRWKGLVRSRPIPAGGVTLNLEVQEGRRWKIFEQIVTDHGGRFHFIYQFHSTTESTLYGFRVALPKVGSAGYDYAPGASNSVAVRVRP
jgi:hypothetical protein